MCAWTEKAGHSYWFYSLSNKNVNLTSQSSAFLHPLAHRRKKGKMTLFDDKTDWKVVAKNISFFNYNLLNLVKPDLIETSVSVIIDARLDVIITLKSCRNNYLQA